MRSLSLYHRPVNDASTHNPDRDLHPQIGRGHPTLARILRRWRELTGARGTRDPQRRTIVACSGGADSVLLAIALSRFPQSCVIAHITHDLRETALTDQDHAFVRSLATRLGIPFVHQSVQVSSVYGNTEANARTARYDALCNLSALSECQFIATGHHADDQLETLLMHLMRGSGTRGMIGVHAAQPLIRATLIRPMLDLTRSQIETALAELGFPWCEDHTNFDTTLLRNRIRHNIIPLMREISPDTARHASEWGRDLASIQGMIDQRVQSLTGECQRLGPNWEWSRATLRDQPSILLGYLPGEYLKQTNHLEGLDQITRRAIESWTRAVKSDSTEPTTHRIGPIVAVVRANDVVFSPVPIDFPNEEDLSC